MLRLFIIFSSCFDKNLLEKWLEINDFGLDIIGRQTEGLNDRGKKSSISAIMAIIADMLQNLDKMTLLEWHMFAILDT